MSKTKRKKRYWITKDLGRKYLTLWCSVNAPHLGYGGEFKGRGYWGMLWHDDLKKIVQPGECVEIENPIRPIRR